MYSQFSDVKFSSVALAARSGQSKASGLSSAPTVETHQRRRRKRSAELGTYSDNMIVRNASQYQQYKGESVGL